MKKTAHRVGGDHSQGPQYQQNDADCPEHVVASLLARYDPQQESCQTRSCADLAGSNALRTQPETGILVRPHETFRGYCARSLPAPSGSYWPDSVNAYWFRKAETLQSAEVLTMAPRLAPPGSVWRQVHPLPVTCSDAAAQDCPRDSRQTWPLRNRYKFPLFPSLVATPLHRIAQEIADKHGR